MDYLLYLMFRCDFDVMESLDVGGFVGSKHTPSTCIFIPGMDGATTSVFAVAHMSPCRPLPRVVTHSCTLLLVRVRARSPSHHHDPS